MALFRKCSFTLISTLLGAAVLGRASQTFAEFRSPVRISRAKVGSFQIGFDFFENLILAYEENGELILETRGNEVLDRRSLGAGTNPTLAFNSQAAWVAFSAPPLPEGAEHKIFLVTRAGSQWSARQNFSEGPGDDLFPQLALESGRSPVVVWERRPANAAPQVWFHRGKLSSQLLGQGERPALALDSLGRAHVLFLRSGDIFYVREDSSSRRGIFTPPLNITSTPSLEESAPRVAIADGRTLYLCFSSGGDIYLASTHAGKFGEPDLLAQGATDPCVSISPTGALAIAFEKDGELFSSLGTTFLLPEPAPVLKSPEVESAPSVAVDSFANVFIGFRRGDDLYYVTNAGPPVARFEANPVTGEAPLRVEFKDTSKGNVTGWAWDLGDGAVSHDPNPSHLYAKSGQYTVALQVTGPGGESPLIYRRVVFVLDPSNEMRISPVSAFPGQRGVHVPVLATHKDPAQGFTITATYDPAVLLVRSVEFENTNIDGLKPELFAVNISDDPEEPYVTAGILFDVTTPFDGRVIPPGKDHRIANILIDVRTDAPAGTKTEIELKNNVGRPPLSNIFTVGGYSILPFLGEGGGVAIQRLPFPPPRFFLRGDADASGAVNISDVILTLSYLFAGSGALACADAADVTDDGHIDISDAVFTLNFLFRSGNYPPPPFPDPGLDPTQDELPPCLLR